MNRQLFVDNNQPPGSPFGGCPLNGISLGGGRYLANLGSILVAFIAILVSVYLLLRSNRKAAAVGRREMQVFLIGYIIIEICEIFTVGGFPLNHSVRKGFSAVHVAAIAATTWVLLLNALVGFQLLDDGTPISLALLLGSAAAIAIGTGYIALDVAFSYTGFFDSTHDDPNRAMGLYILYQLFPLICLVLFFICESILVLRVLGEKKPMRDLVIAALLFAIGQIFQYVISVHLCTSTSSRINGAFFETLFTLLSVVAIWKFWSEITEDDWPMPVSGSTYT
jgi:Chitin synthase export chaperone